VRISPATAKYKPPITGNAFDLPQVKLPDQHYNGSGAHEQAHPATVAFPFVNAGAPKGGPAAMEVAASSSSINSNGNNSVPSSGSGSSLGVSYSSNSFSSGSSTSLNSLTSEDIMNLPNNVLAQIAQNYAKADGGAAKHHGHDSITQQLIDARRASGHGEGDAPQFIINEESWKHQARARAILGNLIGPNGEQLTSTDPYNTTVFVGGLSPLISEDTLRTFFAPFGDIHYVFYNRNQFLFSNTKSNFRSKFQ
jgi:hypothetical protein